MRNILLTALIATFLISGAAFSQPPEDMMPGMHRGHGMKGMMGNCCGMGQGPGFGPMMGMGGPGQVMGMNLTEDQQKKIAELKRDHQRKMIEIASEEAGLHGKVKLMITADRFKQSDADDLTEKITRFQRDRMTAHIQHMRTVRDLLTPEQRVKFDQNVMSRGDRPGGSMMKKHRMFKKGRCW